LLVLLIVAGDLGERPARAGDPKGAAWAALGLGRIPQTRQGTRSQRMTRRAGDKSEVLAMVSDGSGGPGEPGAASSLYMTSTRTGRSRQRGCHFAHHAAVSGELRGSIVVLDFGRAARAHRRFGVSLFGNGFRSTRAVASAAEAYAAGYATCARRAHGAHLVLALGTSNYGGLVSWRHGVEWASMVNDVSDWVGAHGYSGGVAVAGAIDMELGWSGPRHSRWWTNGYGSVAEHPYFDFGDAAGCPPIGNCIGAWTVEDVWYVSWGARWALPLPEIYAPNGSSAREWQRLSLYSERRHGTAMTIAGVMSQHTACRQSRDPCWGMNNSPARAWRLLSRALNSDRRTAQPLRWLTDVRWDR